MTDGSPLPMPLAQLARPLGRLFEWTTAWRRHRFESGRGGARRLDRPVVSIGNLTVGGTGKTPFTILLAQALRTAGIRPAVLSRGYGGRREVDPMVVDASSLASEVGDEPLLMAGELSDVPVVVGRSRYEAGRLAEKRFSIDVHLLDDGLQHLMLERDCDVVMVPVAADLERARCLPAGVYREGPTALRAASFVVVKGNGSVPDELRTQVRALAPEASIHGARLTPREVSPLGPGGGHPPRWLDGRSVAALAAIGDPGSFRSTLEELGASVVHFETFADHHAFTAAELSRMVERARRAGAEAVVCTSKDALRLPTDAGGTLPFYHLRVGMEVDRMELIVSHVQSLVEAS